MPAGQRRAVPNRLAWWWAVQCACLPAGLGLANALASSSGLCRKAVRLRLTEWAWLPACQRTQCFVPVTVDGLPAAFKRVSPPVPHPAAQTGPIHASKGQHHLLPRRSVLVPASLLDSVSSCAHCAAQ